MPTEVYKQYSDKLLPYLLFNAARNSMAKANIILLLKPSKDSTDPGFSRPISLLQSDIEILAEVLALRLNKAISLIIHPVSCHRSPWL